MVQIRAGEEGEKLQNFVQTFLAIFSLPVSAVVAFKPSNLGSWFALQLLQYFSGYSYLLLLGDML